MVKHQFCFLCLHYTYISSKKKKNDVPKATTSLFLPTLAHRRGHLLEGKWNCHSFGCLNASPNLTFTGTLHENEVFSILPILNPLHSLFICHLGKKSDGFFEDGDQKICKNIYLKAVSGNWMFRCYDNTRWTL